MYTPSFWQLKKVRPSQFTYITSSFRAMKMHKLAQSFWKLCSTLKHHCRGRNCKNAHKCTKSSQIDQVLPTLICPREMLGLFMVRWRLCTLSTISSIFSDFYRYKLPNSWVFDKTFDFKWRMSLFGWFSPTVILTEIVIIWGMRRASLELLQTRLAGTLVENLMASNFLNVRYAATLPFSTEEK